MSLFQNHIPLARRCAPRNFEQYEGQEHLIGINKPISTMTQKKMVQSMIFYGPPASGKTGLARIISDEIDAEFISVNALNFSSEDIKKLFQQATHNQTLGKQTILFVDEIHRLTRPKQDVFLEALETGLLILIGATTENPYFILQPALRSRLLIFEFFTLSKDNLQTILHRALQQDSLLQQLQITITSDAEEFLIQHSSDPRNMLTILETVVLTLPMGSNQISKENFMTVINKADTVYDKENAHYDVISAFIKSIRGSDPDAALYYLSIMIEAGEDPRFIFRRLLISAVEDIGLAYPEAVSIVYSCSESFEKVGYPEGNLFLSHATMLLASLPKSNSILSINNALSYIRQGNVHPVPAHLKDAHYKGAKDLGRGIDYLYPHDYPENFVKQQYMSKDVSFYKPQESGFEIKLKHYLSKHWKNRFY